MIEKNKEKHKKTRNLFYSTKNLEIFISRTAS